MNIYVYDKGWSGADCIVTDTMEEALEHFRSSRLPEYTRRLYKHRREQGHNPWAEYVAKYSGDFSDCVDVYSITKGTIFSTVGEG